jgi:CheY-like chemotaxis protein
LRARGRPPRRPAAALETASVRRSCGDCEVAWSRARRTAGPGPARGGRDRSRVAACSTRMRPAPRWRGRGWEGPPGRGSCSTAQRRRSTLEPSANSPCQSARVRSRCIHLAPRGSLELVKRVLVLDRAQGVRRHVADVLGSLGATVIEAAGGSEALAAVSHLPIGPVVAAVPSRSDEFEALEALRGTGASVVVHSRSHGDAAARAAEKFGADPLLTPLDPESYAWGWLRC